MTAQPVNTYDRRFDEPEDAWTAFWRYRDRDTPGPRPALEGFSTSSGYPVSRLKAWYTKHDWASRLCAWDQRVDRMRQEVVLHGVEEMAQRHIELAKKGQTAAGLALDKVLTDLRTDFGRMKPHEIARLLEVCAKLERLSRGEATERIDEGQDYSKLSDEELQEYERIARKIR